MELEALRKDMVAAMKALDKVTKDAVSSLISAVTISVANWLTVLS